MGGPREGSQQGGLRGVGEEGVSPEEWAAAAWVAVGWVASGGWRDPQRVGRSARARDSPLDKQTDYQTNKQTTHNGVDQDNSTAIHIDFIYIYHLSFDFHIAPQ